MKQTLAWQDFFFNLAVSLKQYIQSFLIILLPWYVVIIPMQLAGVGVGGGGLQSTKATPPDLL